MKSRETPSTTVLIVDDSLDTIRMLNDVLEDAGMTVLVALEGTQALTITQSIVPDVILLDAIMPNMDGFEVCRIMKERPTLEDIPIIFMTGLSDTEHVVMGLNAGGVDYVTKPINTSELLARIQVHLTNARITQSARMALDKTGQFIFAVNALGSLIWATPQVKLKLLKENQQQVPITRTLEAKLPLWLEHLPQPGHTIRLKDDVGPGVEFLAKLSADEFLLRLIDVDSSEQATDKLKHHFPITTREADVLLWIAKGKTNREIGLILEMSPRTVNKHLEQIFKKLGVENRTSAAAYAIRCLAELTL
ncbi:response regulator transcription factor [Nitrincola alkalisediminis]|uniref:response regulator transcription factor n=1 Tax=Nitrincola alkalisediminis TaxID=1366656 RepID=UPI001873F3A3|nr:DNA-binding response regulator [Nitrincola alkalisediminis]